MKTGYVLQHAGYAMDTMRILKIDRWKETPNDLTRKEIPTVLEMAEKIRAERQAALDEVEALIENLEYVFEMLEVRDGDPIMLDDIAASRQDVPNLSALLSEYNALTERGFANTMTPAEGDRLIQLEELLNL